MGRKAQGRPHTPMGRALHSRLEVYSRTRDLRDVDAAVEYLCGAFPEYRRQKRGQFFNLVAKAAEAVRADDWGMTPEKKLQILEGKHMVRHRQVDARSPSRNGDSDATSSSSTQRPSCKRASLDGSSDGESVEMESGRLNSSLRSLYGTDDRMNTVTSQPCPTAASNGQLQANRVEAGCLKGPVTGFANGDPFTSGKAHGPPDGGSPQQEPAQLGQGHKPDPKGSDGQKGKVKRRKEQGHIVAERSEKKRKPSVKHMTMSKTGMTVPKPIHYEDLGGLEDVLRDIKELIEYPLKHPEVYTWLGVAPPRGVLLHGPPGCGKTALAHAIANECAVPFFKVSGPEIVSGMSGESEAKVRALFRDVKGAAPAILFIDEIDAIAAKREHAQREMERRIVAQLLTCMDDLDGFNVEVETPNTLADTDAPGKVSEAIPTDVEPTPILGHVVVIGATNRPDSLDPALRRAGRFDREIALGIPTEAARAQILTVLLRKLRLEGGFDVAHVARKTPGFVGADLDALTKEAAAVAVRRIFSSLDTKASGCTAGEDVEMADDSAPVSRSRLGAGPLGKEELSELAISMEDFKAAISRVQPSLRREGFTTTPDMTWEDVGALGKVREELAFSVTLPIAHPENFEALGISRAAGVLLFGPPGCGKTLVAKAVANEAGANFISIKGPELLNKYVGESERAVRQLFGRAHAARPCVLFFDEMDALAPRRGSDNQAAERVVNQLLTEMDGVGSREGVYIMAATNRPDIIDPALLRPGRLDKVVYIPLPTPTGRVSILRALMRRTPVASDVDIEAIGLDTRCTGFSGADLAALVREACIVALKAAFAVGNPGMADCASAHQVCAAHFAQALNMVKPSVSAGDHKSYDQMMATLRRSRARICADEGGEAGSQPPQTSRKQR